MAAQGGSRATKTAAAPTAAWIGVVNDDLHGGWKEVILNRELKSCPSFSNLKMLSLGEWCMDAEFNALIFFLQHSPNLEKLFLELKLKFNTRKPLDSGVKPKGRSFPCKHLWMVNIKCSEDDARVHKLAHLFRANGIPDEKIFVSYLRGIKMTEFWWED